MCFVRAVSAQPEPNYAREQEIAQMGEMTPGVRVSFDPLLNTPTFIRSTTAFLTRRSTDSALKVVGDFVDANPALFGRGMLEADEYRVVRDYSTPSLGVRHLTLQQVHNGQDVHGSLLTANITTDGMLVNIGSTLVPMPGAEVEPPACGARDAIEAACTAMQDDRVATLLALVPVETECSTDWAAGQDLGGGGVDGLYVRSVLYPQSVTELIQAWQVILPVNPGAENARFECVVDTEGALLSNQNWTFSCREPDPATFRLFTDDSPIPGTPGAATPSTGDSECDFRPSPCTGVYPDTRTLITVEAADIADWPPHGWIDDGTFAPCGTNVTCGNNVRASKYVNGVRTLVSGPNRTFDADYPINFTLDPASYIDAAVIHAFVIGNQWHDRMFALGFDEAAGVYQAVNASSAGVAGDSLHMIVGEGITNAYGNAIVTGVTPNDGEPAEVKLSTMTGPTPDRMAAFDSGVLFHELTHVMVARLNVGQLTGGAQAGGLHEGWGDYFAIALTAESGDDFSANYPVFAYSARQHPNASGLNHYYFGARRFPYSIDMSGRNPLKFGFIDPAQTADFPYGTAPRNTNFDSVSRSERYRIGEVWATMLLDCRYQLSLGHGFDANELLMRLVVNGMKLNPGSPGMIESRDAILQADLLRNGGANQGALWVAFKNRGLGFNAASVGNTASVTNNEDPPPETHFSFFFPAEPVRALSAARPTSIEVLVVNPVAAIDDVWATTDPELSSTTTPIGAGLFRIEFAPAPCREIIEVTVHASTVSRQSNSLEPPVTALGGKTEQAQFDDMEDNDPGWSVFPPDQEAAPGRWQRRDPLGGNVQPWRDGPSAAGTQCWVTENRFSTGTGNNDDDVDGTEVLLTSSTSDPIPVNAGTVALLEFDRWYVSTQPVSSTDAEYIVRVLEDGAESHEFLTYPAQSERRWVRKRYAFSTASSGAVVTTVQFAYRDPANTSTSVVEGGVDNVLFVQVVECCDPDINLDGNIDQDDVAALVSIVGGGANPNGINPDFNFDGNVDQDDVEALIAVVAGGPCPAREGGRCHSTPA
jgi:hypothetical protein